MAVGARSAGELLLRGDLYEVRADARVVRCVLKIPPRTAPALGASAALDLGEWLVSNVLKHRSPWLGLIMDARQGPSVFGPITRSVLERLLDHAEQSRRPVVFLTGDSPTQAEQFRELAQRHAPGYSHVTSDPKQALSWLTESH